MTPSRDATPSHGRFRYGPWRGGPDPLAPPYDVRAALDEVGRDVLAAGSLREALRELLRRGLDGRGGLDELRRAGPPDARRARRRGDLGGTAGPGPGRARPGARRRAGQPWPAEDDDAPGWPRWSWTTLPDDMAGAVRALADYDWQSPEARAAYESIRDMLRSEVLDAQFAGLKQALELRGPARRCRPSGTCWPTSTRCWPPTPGARTPTDQFNEFMDKHGDLFPEQPQDVDELIDALARRQAAAARMMASLVAGAARGAGPADERRPRRRRPRLGDGPALGQPAGPAPGHGPGPAGRDAAGWAVPGLQRRGRGRGRAGRPGGPRAAAVPGHAGATLDDVDVERLEQRLGSAAARDLESLRQLERELEKQGYLARGDDGLRLTPRAVRRLGETALKRVFAQLDATGRGDHDDRHTGAGRRADRR